MPSPKTPPCFRLFMEPMIHPHRPHARTQLQFIPTPTPRTVLTPRKPRVLLAASGTSASVQFPCICQRFSRYADVKVVATKSSLSFIDRASIPENIAFYIDESEWRLWEKVGDPVLHVELGKWADVLVIAPLSANTLAKIANGLCDNLLTCIVRAWDFSKPIFVSPSMHSFMWNNPITETHMIEIDDLGINLIPGNGGKMAEPEFIFDTIRILFESRKEKGDKTFV